MNQRICYERILWAISLFTFCLAACLGFFLQSRTLNIKQHGQIQKKQQLKPQEKAFSLHLFPSNVYDWSFYTLFGLHKLALASIADRPDQDRVSVELAWDKKLFKAPLGEKISLEENDKCKLLCAIDQDFTANFTVQAGGEDVLFLQKKMPVPSRALLAQDGTIALKTSSFWGIDQFQKAYSESSEHKMMGVLNQDGVSFSSFKINDILKQGNLLAQVKAIQPQMMTWQVWNEDGKRSEILNIPLANQKGTFHAKLPQILRLRSPNECSLRFGKQRAIIQIGDWWVQKGDVWEKVSEMKRLKNVLDYKEGQDLIIFDEIAFEEKGIFIKGSYFDPSRTLVQHFALAVPKKEKPKPKPDREMPKKLEPKSEAKK